MANNPQVYVIDDDDAARDSHAFLLESAKLAVASYESAKAFLDAIPALDHGCVISDVRMPEIDGVELLRRLNDISIDWPVIMITGHADVGLAVEAMRRGAVALI